MKTILRILAAGGLGLTIIPALLMSAGLCGHDLVRVLMLAGMLLWFATAVPLRVRR